jgi:predicted O-methyltransferase YrrM
MDTRMAQYLSDFIKHDDGFLDELKKANRSRNDIQPMIEMEIGKLLVFLIKLTKARKVLELGTSNGYSSIWMANALKGTGGHITTIEGHDRMAEEAQKNLNEAGVDNVELIKGKIETVLPELISKKKKYDLIFQDSGKYLYPLMLENTVKLCKKGGIIIADDTLFRVIETVRSGLGDYTHDYNRAVFAHKKLFSTILPIGHGLTMSYRL